MLLDLALAYLMRIRLIIGNVGDSIVSDESEIIFKIPNFACSVDVDAWPLTS